MSTLAGMVAWVVAARAAAGMAVEERGAAERGEAARGEAEKVARGGGRSSSVSYLGLELNGMVNHSGSFDAHDINHHRQVRVRCAVGRAVVCAAGCAVVRGGRAVPCTGTPPPS